MKLLVIGSTGLLGSRILQDLSNPAYILNGIRIRDYITHDSLSPDLWQHIVDSDAVINVSGANSLSLQKDLLNNLLLYESIPLELQSFCRQANVSYIQVTSYHSISSSIAADCVTSPYAAEPCSIYGAAHNRLERSLLESECWNSMSAIVRISNCFGPPSFQSGFKPSHWLNILNSMMLNIHHSEDITIQDKAACRPFIPIGLFIDALKQVISSIISPGSRRQSIYQIISPFMLSLSNAGTVIECAMHDGSADLVRSILDDHLVATEYYTDLAIDQSKYADMFLDELRASRIYLEKSL